MALPRLPVCGRLSACLTAVLCVYSGSGKSTDGECGTAMTSGSMLIQHKSRISRGALETEGSCSPYQSWPNVDNVTCSDCTALVLTGPYGGRCDRYCESFGHVCVAAAEEKDETCQLLQSKQCNEEIAGTSDMLCTCKKANPSPAPPPPAVSSPCYGELAALAAEEGAEVGVIRTQSALACQQACSGNSQCQSASFCPAYNGCWLKDRRFTGSERTRSLADCTTLYRKSCDSGNAPAPPPVAPPSTGVAKIKVVSYNIYWWNAFRDNPWKGHKITDNIKTSLQPDVLGLQECDNPGLVQRRTGYSPASRFAGAQGIMVKSGLFRVVNSGASDIDAAGKWGARYVTWAQLTHKPSGRTFWHFNTHWCVHTGNGRTCGADKRYQGAKNMLQIIRDKAGGAPVIITGDFNAAKSEPGIQHFLRNGFEIAEWHWVDAVMYSAQHWRKGQTGRGEHAHSDHRPVTAELELK